MKAQHRPSDALTKPSRPFRGAAIVAGLAIALSGVGVGAYALSQAPLAPKPVATAEAEPKPASFAKTPNVPPVAVIDASRSPLKVKVDASESTDEDGEIVAYLWDFGDGKTSTEVATTHKYKKSGTYVLTLTVTDDDGDTSTTTVEVKIKKPKPKPAQDQGPPAATAGCPAGSIVAEMQNGVVTYCLWEICTRLTLPDPDHPECDAPFRP